MENIDRKPFDSIIYVGFCSVGDEYKRNHKMKIGYSTKSLKSRFSGYENAFSKILQTNVANIDGFGDLYNARYKDYLNNEDKAYARGKLQRQLEDFMKRMCIRKGFKRIVNTSGEWFDLGYDYYQARGNAQATHEKFEIALPDVFNSLRKFNKVSPEEFERICKRVGT